MQIKEIVKNKLGTIIDVRNAGELVEGVIPGAINIPVSEIPFRVEEIKKMNGPLVLYCRSGNRSGMAMMMLQSAGIKTEMHNGGGYYDMLDYLN
ncbi:MAG: rhodanese-like domain-containing protein [Terrimonas sp.]|nr:rhodanese-like domain-containing protein [Terrimonas sp.]